MRRIAYVGESEDDSLRGHPPNGPEAYLAMKGELYALKIGHQQARLSMDDTEEVRQRHVGLLKRRCQSPNST